jgi:hypothetical protein
MSTSAKESAMQVKKAGLGDPIHILHETLTSQAQRILRDRARLLMACLGNADLVDEGKALSGDFSVVKSDTVKKWLLDVLNKRSALPIPQEAVKKALKELKVLASILPQQEGTKTTDVVFMVSVGGHDDRFFAGTEGASATIGRSNSLLFRFKTEVLKRGAFNDKKLKRAFEMNKYDVFIHAPGTTKFFELSKTEGASADQPLEGNEKQNGENATFYSFDAGDHYIVVVCSKNAPFAFRVRKSAERDGFKSVGAFLASKESLNTNEQAALVLCNLLCQAPNLDDVLQVMLSQQTMCELMNPHFVYNGELDTDLCVLFARQFNDGPTEQRNGSPIDPQDYEEVFVKAGFTRPKKWIFEILREFMFAAIEGIVPYDGDGNPNAKCKTCHYQFLKWLIRELLYALTWKTSRTGATNSFTKWLVDAGLKTVDLVSANLDKVFNLFQENSRHRFDKSVLGLVREHWETYFVPRLQVILEEVRTGELTHEVIDKCSVGMFWYLADCEVRRVSAVLNYPECFTPSVVKQVETGSTIPPAPLMVLTGKVKSSKPLIGGGGGGAKTGTVEPPKPPTGGGGAK